MSGVASSSTVGPCTTPAPVDLETEPVSGDLFDVDIDTGSIHRISYVGP